MKHSLSNSKQASVHLLSQLLPYLKRKRILFGSMVVLISLILAAVMSVKISQKSDFLVYEQNIEVLKYQGQLRIAVNDVLLDHVIYAEKYQSYSSSIDGNIAVLLTDSKELYLVKDRGVKRIAEDVLHFEISSTGEGIAYAQQYMQAYALSLYNTKENTRCEITDQLTKLDFSLSPDGQTLAYYIRNENGNVLMCHCDGKELTISDDEVDLVGLSNDGKHIYATLDPNGDGLSLYSFNRRGKKSKLGAVTSNSFKFNSDHQQIMFYNNGQTLVSTNGQAAITVSSYPLYLVIAPNSFSASDGNSITLPVHSLFNHVYTCSDGASTSAWLIQKKPDDSKKLASEVSGCTLDASFEYLYFTYKQRQLCVVNVSSKNTQIRTLADDVDFYVVTSNRSKAYFTNDKALYCTNGKKAGTPKLILADINDFSLFISDSDTVYFLKGNELYRSKNSSKAKLYVKDIQTLYSSSNNVVYIIGNNKIYSAYQKRNPEQILGAE